MSRKEIDTMTLAELREYARELEKRLATYEAPDTVYFLLDESAQVIKVGHSKNVKERLRVLERQSKRTLTLLGVIPGDKYLKRTIQQQFKALLTDDAEWYRVDETLMAYINEHAVPLEGEG